MGFQGRAGKYKCPEPRWLEALGNHSRFCRGSFSVMLGVGRGLTLKSCVSQFIEGFPGGSDGKESTCSAGDPGLIPGSGISLEKATTTHSSILAWTIPWTEDPGVL